MTDYAFVRANALDHFSNVRKSPKVGHFIMLLT